MSETGTKERILDVAEALFGDSGFAGTSLRALTARAGVNLAAVHYHFGSKEALLQAVVERRVAPVNQQRRELLAKLEQSSDEDLTVEGILEAFLAPALGLGEQEGSLRRILGRMYGEPAELVGPIIEQQFGDLARRFAEVLSRALPDVPPAEVRARFEFTVGTMVHVISGNSEITHRVLGLAPPSVQETVRQMVAFLAAGMRAPVPGSGA